PGRSGIFTAGVSDPNPGDQIRLEVEVKPVGTAFDGVVTGTGPAVANGAVATAAVAGLSDNTAYHWRARAVDQTSRASAWLSFGNNPESATDFQVAVAATQLAFTVQPSAAVAGVAITPAVKVAAQDALGNTLTSFNGQPSTAPAGAAITPAILVTARDSFGNTATGFAANVTLAIGSNPSGGTLSGTATQTAVTGIASFSGLTIDKAGAGYTLTAAATGLATGISAPFTITAAAAGKLALVTPPAATAQSGVPLTRQPTVQVQDSNGNPVNTQGVLVTAAIATGPPGASVASAVA